MRIKANWYFLLCGLLLISCSYQEGRNNNLIAQISIEEQDTVRDLSERLRGFFESGKCHSFINDFPNNFEKFLSVYGYRDDDFAKNYDVALDHVNYFFQCGNDSAVIVYSKALDIARNGYWQADAVSIFQRRLIELILDDPKLYIEYSEKLDDNELYSLNYFLLDGPAPTDPMNLNRFNLLQNQLSSSPRSQELLQSAYDAVKNSYAIEKGEKN